MTVTLLGLCHIVVTSFVIGACSGAYWWARYLRSAPAPIERGKRA
jgi:hypothetical protein